MSEPDLERLGLAGLEDLLPVDYFEELIERIDRRELGMDMLEMVAFALLEATTCFTEMLLSVGLILDPEVAENE